MRLEVSGQLTSLDVSRNTALTRLEVSGQGQLTSLDVSRNTALRSLGVWDGQLTSLDVRNNTALIELFVEYTQLTNLDVSNNTELRYLRISRNQLTTSVLNTLFESLPQGHSRYWDRWEQRYIYSHRIFIGNNPGANEANTSIASARGWGVYLW